MSDYTNLSTYRVFIAYCDYARKAFNAMGILIYTGQSIKVAGFPYLHQNAVNDNKAKP